MTTATKLARVDANGFLVLNGKANEARKLAFGDIATVSFLEGKSRADTIDTIRKALGKNVTTQALEIAQREWVIGRVASRLAVTDLPNAKANNPVDRIAYARDLVMHYAMPAKDGVKSALRGKKGYRTVAQHKVIRAAAEAWSQLKAEIAPEQSNAKTQATKNAAKKNGATMAGDGRGKAKPQTAAAAPSVTLSHPELVKAPSEMTPVEARAHIVTQAAALLSFANKYAGQLPTDFGKATRAFKAAIDKAEALAVSVAS